MDFFGRELWQFVVVRQEVTKLAKSAVDDPPMQDPASFNLDAVRKQFEAAIRNRGQSATIPRERPRRGARLSSFALEPGRWFPVRGALAGALTLPWDSAPPGWQTDHQQQVRLLPVQAVAAKKNPVPGKS
jgi:hypothetical protein